MGWFFGAGMGFLLGGPLGAMVGGVMQHVFTQQDGEKMLSVPNSKINQEAVFITNLAVIMTRVAMADGFISREEITVIHNFFAQRLGYKGIELRYIDGIIKETERVKPDLTQVCTTFQAHANPEICLLLLDMTYQIASTDQKITDEEQREINNIAVLIGISSEDHARIKTKYFSNQKNVNNSYSILGLSEGASSEEIKKAYRVMAAQYHPDKVSHLGEELIEFAHKKFGEINTAYEDLKKKNRV